MYTGKTPCITGPIYFKFQSHFIHTRAHTHTCTPYWSRRTLAHGQDRQLCQRRVTAGTEGLSLDAFLRRWIWAPVGGHGGTTRKVIWGSTGAQGTELVLKLCLLADRNSLSRHAGLGFFDKCFGGRLGHCASTDTSGKPAGNPPSTGCVKRQDCCRGQSWGLGGSPGILTPSSVPASVPPAVEGMSMGHTFLGDQDMNRLNSRHGWTRGCRSHQTPPLCSPGWPPE